MPRTRRRFTPEFKTEAVKLLEESGRPLQAVAEELGVHANQLRGWRNEQLAAGSAEALARQKAEAAELARLRRENKRLEQENEILRRAAAFFRPGGGPVMRFRFVAAERASFPVRMLCRVVGAAASGFYAWLRRGPGPARGCRSGPPGAGGGDLRGEPADLRQPAGPRRAARPGRAGGPEQGRAADARGRALGQAPAPRPAHDRQPARPPGGAEPARAALHGRPARRGLARGHLLPPDRGGLAVPGRDRGHGHARDRRLEHGRPSRGRPRLRRPAHGDPPPAAAARADPPFRSRGAVREPALPGDPGPPRPALLDEPARELLGQRAHGELLRQPEDRARPPHQVPDPGGGEAGDLRIRGELLQPPTPPLRRSAS